MKTTERNVMELQVPGTPEQVFAYLTDLRRLPEWDRPVKVALPLDDSMRVGARWEIRLRGVRTRRPIVLTVADLSHPSRCEFIVRGSRVTAHDVIELTASGSTSTSIRVIADIELRGLFAPGIVGMKLAGPLLRAVTVFSMRRAVRRAVPASSAR